MAVDNTPDQAETRFDSTDDARVDNNSARHRYRKLSNGEKMAIDDIKTAGQDVIDTMEEVVAAGREFVNMLNEHLDPQSSDANVAVRRSIEALGIEADYQEDTDTYHLSFPESHTKTIQVQEAIMWAVRSITT